MRGYIMLVFRNSFIIFLSIFFCIKAYAADGAQLNIYTPQNNKIAEIHVEIADDDAERSRGFMFRRDIPENTGMLFLFSRPQRVSFWMKDTFVPLDIIFISPDLRISQIHYNAVPHDLTPISSNTEVSAALEVKAGEVARLGLKKGQKIRHPALALP
jgi:uncharacterized protein